MRLFQPLLLFFLVKYRTEDIRGVIGIAAEGRDILRLVRLIPDNQVAVTDGGVRGAAVMALVIGTAQPIDRQIIQDLTGGGLAEADARAGVVLLAVIALAVLLTA